jgi:hypothetical protein
MRIASSPSFFDLVIRKKMFSTKIKYFLPFVAVVVMFTSVQAQPINDSLKSITLRNEKNYRMLNQMDDKGASYAFTNITAWKITDEDLKNQIISVYTAQYGTKQLKNFDVSDVYVFSAPAGVDASGSTKYEPFHVLFMGKRVNVDTSGGAGEDIFFGGGRRKNNAEKVPIAFKGREVIRTMARQPALKDNLNTIQGEIVELPGDILPRGVQLIKNSTQRYIFHQMFSGFYSKRQIIDEQSRANGGPTLDEELTSTDSDAVVIQPDADETPGLTEEQLNSRAFRYQRTIDLAIDHLSVNISRQNAIELQIGNPEVGLPFWSSGEARLSLNMRNQIGTESDFRLGLDMPNFGLGDVSHAIFQPRKLSGFWGGSLSAYFAGIDFFSAFNMPIAFNFTVIPAQGTNSSIIYNGSGGVSPNNTVIDPSRTFYRTSFIGQLYIPFIVQLDPANFIQFSAGVGVHTVRLSWIPKNDSEAVQYGYSADQGGTMQDLTVGGRPNVSTPFTPHVGVEYVNHRANKFGLNFQYDHLFTFGGWLELVPDHLRLEASFTAPLVRDPKPYEPSSFFMFTPRLYF